MQRPDLSFDSVFGSQYDRPDSPKIDLSFEAVFGPTSHPLTGRPYVQVPGEEPGQTETATERSMTFGVDEQGNLIDGLEGAAGFVNFPSIWDGKQQSPGEAYRRAREAGEVQGPFPDHGMATYNAQVRSDMLETSQREAASGQEQPDRETTSYRAKKSQLTPADRLNADRERQREIRDIDRWAIGEEVIEKAKRHIQAGWPIDELDQDVVNFMLDDNARYRYVAPEQATVYDQLRSTLVSKQDVTRSSVFDTQSRQGFTEKSDRTLGEVLDVGRMAGRGVTTTASGTLRGLGIAARFVYEDVPEFLGLGDTAYGRLTSSMGQAIGSALKAAGDTVDETALPYLQNELFVNRMGQLNQSISNWRTWLNNVGEGAGQMVPMVGVASLMGKFGKKAQLASVFGMGSSMAADQIYQGVRDILDQDPSLSEEEKDSVARQYAVTGGVMSGVLEVVGLDRVLKVVGGKRVTAGQLFNDVLIAAATEGLTEALQTSLEQTLVQIADPTIPESIRAGLLEEFLVGMAENLATEETALAAGAGAIVGGGAATVLGTPATKRRERQARRVAEEYVREREAGPDARDPLEPIDIEGQQEVYDEATDTYIPATIENIARLRAEQRQRVEQEITESQETTEQVIQDANLEDSYLVVDDESGDVNFTSDMDQASEYAPEGTQVDPKSQAEAYSVAHGGRVVTEAEYQREQNRAAAERRRAEALADPQVRDVPEVRTGMQALDRAIDQTAESQQQGLTHETTAVPEDQLSPFGRKLQEMGKRIGIEVVVVDSVATNEAGETVESLFTGGIDPNNSNRIYVVDPSITVDERGVRVDPKRKQQRSVLSVLGHEIFHSLERQNPELVDALMAALPAEFHAALNQYRETGLIGMDSSLQLQVSEGFAQLLENTLMGLGTESLLQNDTGMLRKLKDFLRRSWVKMGMRGTWAREILDVVEQLTGGRTLEELELTGRQKRRGERLRERAARPRPERPGVEVAPEAVVTEPDEEEAPAQFAAAPPVNSPEFRRWFEDSKVVDEQGEPLVVYHGTTGQFTEFRPSTYGKHGPGIYFTDNASEANLYAEAAEWDDETRKHKGQVHSTYLSMQSPLRLESGDVPADVIPGLQEVLYETKAQDEQQVIQQAIKDAGYDGIIEIGEEGVSNEYVVFDPTQVKSATANVGTYDPGDPDIRFAAAPPVQSPEFRRWFKDSEIVNEQGEPQLAFHGTKQEFTEFRPRFGDGLMFFTLDPKFASDWMEGQGGVRQASDEVIAEAKEMRVYENQLYDELGIRDIDPSTDSGLLEYDRITKTIKDRMTERYGFESASRYKDVGGTRVMPVYLSVQKLFDPRKHWNLIDLKADSKQFIEAAKRGNWSVYEYKDTVDQIKALGFDGMLLSESALEDSPLNTVAIFDPTQVKSATANVGTYDPGDPDIRFAAARSSKDYPNWKQHKDGRLLGYRVSKLDGDRAISGADSRQSWSMSPGTKVSLPGQGLFLINTPDYAISYYAVHDKNVLQEFAFEPNDMSIGNLSDAEPEIAVRNAELVSSRELSDEESGIQFAARRVPKVKYRTATAREIVEAHKANKRQIFLSPKDPGELQTDIDHGKVIAVISDDGTSGYLLDRNDPDDISLGYDIQGVFNIGPVKGAGQAALADAISRGGRTLDAYDGYLPALYSRYGFVETHRSPYNEKFADDKLGPIKDKPDVVLMTYVREETDAEQIIKARTGPTTAERGPYNISKDGRNWPDFATRVAGLLRAPVSEQPADGGALHERGDDLPGLLDPPAQFAARQTITTGNLKVDLQTAIDLVARTGIDPEVAARQVGVEPTKPNITAIRAKSQAGLREVKGKTVGGVPVSLSVPAAIKTIPLGKPVAAGTPNLDTLQQLDVLAAEYPNVLQSDDTFIEFMTAVTRTRRVPPPAYRALEYNADSSVLEEMISNIGKPMLDAANDGITQGDTFRELAEQGSATPEATALLFLWGVNSKMLTPYYQESSALDVYRNPELRDQINSAVVGDFDLQDWFEAVDRMYGPEFKGPGKSAKANLRSYGKYFLLKMSKFGPSGNTYLQELHDMFWDYEIPSAVVRRRFLTNMPQGIGLQSKVFSFLMLVSGRRDVLVMDRIAIRHLYDDGRYDNRASLYEDLASMYDGGIGLAMYEALERSLSTLVENAYASIGRPDDGDLAHFHWESWNNYGFQEATHGSLEYISAFMASDTEGMALAYAAEGRGNTVEYGARWQLVDGVASIVYPTPYLETEAWLFDAHSFSEFTAALRLEASGVLPSRWYDKSRQLKAEQKTARAGIVTAGVIRLDVAEDLKGGKVWHAAKGVDYGKIQRLAEQYGQPYVEGVGKIVSGQANVGPRRGEAQFAARPAEERQLGVFYSQLGRVMRGAKQRKWEAGALRAYLVKNGVKQEEMYWSGLDEYLKENPKVDLDEAMDAIGGVQLDEKWRAGSDEEIEIDVIIDAGTLDDAGEIRHEARGVTSNRDERFYEIFHYEDAGNVSVRDERGNWLDINAPINNQTMSNAKQAIEEDMEARYGFEEGVSPVQFESWTLPGGEDYRELTITLRTEEEKTETEWIQERDELWEEIESLPEFPVDANPLVQARWARENAPTDLYEQWSRAQSLGGGLRQNIRRTEEGSFISHAYDEPNILVWTRFNTRRGPNGEKILFIEEIQSDWHQEGREKGYLSRGGYPSLETLSREDLIDALVRNDPDGIYRDADVRDEFDASPLTKEEATQTIERLANESDITVEDFVFGGRRPQISSVQPPDAPFKKTWPDFALKRLIGHAVGEGFDGIAWTTGEQQARRYEKIVAENVDEIIVTKNERGNYTVGAMRRGRGETWDVPERQLVDYIGKDMATEVRDRMAAGERSVTIPTENFTVGGKGMNVFYDKIIPQAARKIGKKFGTKVEQQEMDTGTQPSLMFPEKMKGAVPEFAQFAARKPKRTPSVKEQHRWMTGQRDRGTPESRQLRESMRKQQQTSRATYNTIVQAAKAKQAQIKQGFRNIEKMRKELRQLMQEILPKNVRGNYLTMLTDVKNEKQMRAALQRIIMAAAKSAWSEEVRRFDKAAKRVKRHPKIPDTDRQKLTNLIENGKDTRNERVPIKSGPKKGQMRTQKKDIKSVDRNVQSSLTLANTTNEILETLSNALELKRSTLEGRSQTVEQAIEEIQAELEETRDPLAQTTKAGGEKSLAKQAGEETRTVLGKRVLLWHAQIPNIIKRITGKIDGSSVLHRLLVDNLRRAETAMNHDRHDIIESLEEAAKAAGFKSLAEMSIKLDAAHGLGLAAKLIPVTLGGKTYRLLHGEVLHLALMDPQTRASIENGSPLMVHRAGKSAAKISGVTLDEIDAAAARLDPRLIEFGIAMKNILEAHREDMFRALRRIKGYDPTMVAEYWPVSRHLGGEELSRSHPAIQAMLDGSGGMGGVASVYAENAGMTIERRENTSPIYIKPALSTFSQHADTALRIIHMADAIRVADSVTRSDRIAEAITDRYGRDVYNAIRRYLIEATGMAEPVRGPLDSWLRRLSSNLAGSYIMLNTGTMLIQVSGIPRLLGRIGVRDFLAGVTWSQTAALKGTLGSTLEQSGFFKDRWARSTISRFGPHKYGGMVPVNLKGFHAGVGRAVKSLATADLKGASGSWASAIESIQVLDAIDRYIAGVAYGASLSRARRESPLLNESQLHERALEYAEDDIRETQNSSSRLDHSVAASSWRGSAAGEAFLMFSSDRFAFLNRITWAQAQYRKGNSNEGAKALAGATVSLAMEPALRWAHRLAWVGLLAAIFGNDDDRKKFERAEKLTESAWSDVVRSVTGISPIFGTAIETAASAFTDMFYPDTFLGSAVGDASSQIARETGRLVNEIQKMTTAEADASIEKLLASGGKLLNNLASLFIGNPIHPVTNKVLRGWEGNANDAVSDIRALDRHYDKMSEDFVSDAQRQYAARVKSLAKKLRGVKALREKLQALEVRERNGENVQPSIDAIYRQLESLEKQAVDLLNEATTYDDE